MGLIDPTTVLGLPMAVGAHSEAEVQVAIDLVSEAIESFCERTLGQVVDDTVTVSPYYMHVHAMPSIAPMTAYGSYPGYGATFSAYGSPYIGSAMLDDPPISGITTALAYMASATDDGLPGWKPLSNYMWHENGLVWDTTGMPGVEMTDMGPYPSWPQMPYSLQFTYTHGYVLPGQTGTGPPLPKGLVSAVIRGVSYVLSNFQNVGSVKVGDVSTSFYPPSFDMEHGMSLARLGLDEALIGRYRIVHLGM